MKNLRKYGAAPFKVVLVHGGPGAPGHMAPVARNLAADMGVLEPLQTADSLEGQVTELKDVLEENGELPVTLVGFSWGAWLSIILTAREPALVKKLVIIGCAPLEEAYSEGMMEARLKRLNKEERIELERITEIVKAPEANDKKEAFRRLGVLYTKADAYDPIAYKSEVIDYQVEVYRKVWNAAAELRKSGKLLELAGSIKCRVTAIHGDHDSHPAEGVQKPLEALLKDFEFVLLENCGHMPWVERQAGDRFYEIIRKKVSAVANK